MADSQSHNRNQSSRQPSTPMSNDADEESSGQQSENHSNDINNSESTRNFHSISRINSNKSKILRMHELCVDICEELNTETIRNWGNPSFNPLDQQSNVYQFLRDNELSGILTLFGPRNDAHCWISTFNVGYWWEMVSKHEKFLSKLYAGQYISVYRMFAEYYWWYQPQDFEHKTWQQIDELELKMDALSDQQIEHHKNQLLQHRALYLDWNLSEWIGFIDRMLTVKAPFASLFVMSNVYLMLSTYILNACKLNNDQFTGICLIPCNAFQMLVN